MTKCSHIARGFSFGNGMASAVEVRLKAGFGFKASAAFAVSNSMPEIEKA